VVDEVVVTAVEVAGLAVEVVSNEFNEVLVNRDAILLYNPRQVV